MRRPLLPFQRNLAEVLGITEDEMQEFVALQRDHTISPEERAGEITNEVATIALVLFAVGTIFQIAGALLQRPEPEKKGPKGRRSEIFAPRYGFNSTQELAKYGDPINLVYTNKNDNPNGGVRVNTSLLWSSVESYGTTQFMQLLLLVGAAKIKDINFKRVAFGQLPVKQLGDDNIWIYYDPNGPVRFRGDRVLGNKKDPAREGAAATDIVHRIKDGANWREGYSQAFTPSAMTTCGVYAPIPINVEWMERGSAGKKRWKDLGIRIAGGSWGGSGGRYRKGDRFELVFEQADRKKNGLARESAKDMRQQLVNNLDVGSTYQLGSAQFRMNWATDEVNIQKGTVRAQFECIKPGRHPTTNYGRTRAKTGYGDAREESVNDAVDILSGDADEPVQEMSEADKIKAYTNVNGGARSAYNPDAPSLRGSDDEQRKDDRNFSSFQTGAVVIDAFGFKYVFNSNIEVKWRNDLDEVKRLTINPRGSIKKTKRDLEAFLSAPPKISTKKLRKEYRSDLEKARQLRDDVQSGEYDKKFRRDARALNRAIREVKQEIDFRTDQRRDAEKAFEGNNNPIRDNEKTIDDLTEKIDEERARNNPDLGRIRNWRDRRRRKRDENRDLKRGRDTGDDGKKRFNDFRLKDLRELKKDLEDDDKGVRKKAYVRFIRNARSPFVGLDGNRYAAGIRALVDKIDNLSGEKTVDQWGVNQVRKAYRALIKEKQEALRKARWLSKNWDELERDLDDAFFCKAICKSDYIAYQTVTACNYVKLNIRARVFRRIDGRDKKYGRSDAPDGFKRSDNGVKARSTFFTVRYRSTDSTGGWVELPTIFVIRRGADQDNFVTLKFESNVREKYEFEIRPISDPAAEIRENGQKDYTFIENAGRRRSVGPSSGKIQVIGSRVALDFNLFPDEKERGPIYTNEWDLFSNRSDSRMEGSLSQGPELSLLNVTEQQRCNIAGKYKGMSLMAMHMYSSQGLQDLRSVSAFVTEGKESWKIGDNASWPSKTTSSTSYAPDVFTDTVMDPENGIGATARPEGVDWASLSLCKRFCKNNGLGTRLFFDGVISELGNWREFWSTVAPYSLLEFARINGRDTLVPAIPVTSTGQATRSIKIDAIFNTGNILPDSLRENWIDYGDNTRDLVGTAIYRETRTREIFPRNNSVTLCLSDTNTADATWQTFDLSDYVSTREQAILFLRLLCRQRRHIRKSAEFRTIPVDTPVSPGSYIILDTGKNTWDGITTGVIEPGGTLNLPMQRSVRNGTYNAMLYRSGGNPETRTGIVVTNNTAPALANRVGALVVLGNVTSSKAVYRITEVEIDETGEATVRCVEHPCTGSGNNLLSRVADLSAGGFKEIGVDCL